MSITVIFLTMLQTDDLVRVFVNSLAFVLNKMFLMYPGRNIMKQSHIPGIMCT